MAPLLIAKTPAVLAGELVQIIGATPSALILAMGMGSGQFDASKFWASINSPTDVMFLCLLVVVPGLAFFVGQRIKQRRPWARVVGITMSSIALFLVPIGTALGGYALYQLTSRWNDR